MKIKDYVCSSCGNDDFFTSSNKKNPKIIGIYCSYCGKYFKWASKDEKNLLLKENNECHSTCSKN